MKELEDLKAICMKELGLMPSLILDDFDYKMIGFTLYYETPGAEKKLYALLLVLVTHVIANYFVGGKFVFKFWQWKIHLSTITLLIDLFERLWDVLIGLLEKKKEA